MPLIGKHVLLVDDDEQLVELLAMKLTKAGYLTATACKPEEGYRQALQGEFDVIVLDLLMPRLGGMDICKNLRGKGIMTPIIILSGQTEKGAIINGLNAGADDYMTKPFDDSELDARITALLRRNRRSYHTDTLERDGITLDTATRILHSADRSTVLTGKETMLLKRLMAEAPKPTPRLSLLHDVWGISGDHASNRLDVYIRRLRQKLRFVSGQPYIHTIRGGGYYFGELLAVPRLAIRQKIAQFPRVY
jgi:DNA-binding response OmpR family regulator